MSTTMINNETKEKQKDDLQTAYDRLEQAVACIDTNEEWLKYLKFQSRFYSYSFYNSILIWLQNPAATYVAGFSSWNQLNRLIKKGEHSIKIFAPIKYKMEKEGEDSVDTKGVFILKGFRLVSVFDLSQTTGDDSKLPVVISGIRESNADHEELYQRLRNKIEIPITEVDSMAAKGSYNPETKEIQIKSSLSSIQKVKTLIHELAHHIHLTKYFNDETRDIGEVMAESTAYVVCQHLGIDSGEYSFGYIKTWAKEPEIIKTVGGKVQKIARKIIEKFEA